MIRGTHRAALSPNYGTRASSSQEASILQQSRILLGLMDPFRTRHKTLHLIGTGTPRTTLIPLDYARSALAPPDARRNCKMRRMERRDGRRRRGGPRRRGRPPWAVIQGDARGLLAFETFPMQQLPAEASASEASSCPLRAQSIRGSAHRACRTSSAPGSQGALVMSTGVDVARRQHPPRLLRNLRI